MSFTEDLKDVLVKHWPQKGDRLFTQGPSWEKTVQISTWGEGLLTYALGYKSAADHLIENFEHLDYRDFVVYPICYLYRHYVELILKGLIVQCQIGEGKSGNFPTNHDVLALWKQFREHIEQIQPDVDDANETVERSIREFVKHDPCSDSFRYPIRRDGTPTLEGLTLIDLQNLQTVMGRISGLLEGSYDYLDDLNQNIDNWY